LEIVYGIWLEYFIKKKIGADVKIQKMYKTMLIFVMLLKLSLFFVLMSAIEVIWAFNDGGDDGLLEFRFKFPKRLYYFHLATTILILLLLVLGYYSSQKEFKIGMVIYLILSTVALIDFILVLKESLRNIADSWYFFIVFIATAIIVSFTTWIWGIFAFLNFGKGLLLANVSDEISKTNQQALDGRHAIEDEEEIS
jgi:hypothetical protein